MAMVGWDYSAWSKNSPQPSHELLSSLAGNSFSLWAFGPIVLSAIAALGLDAAQRAEFEAEA
eukprot:6122754-Alexandrium_andersonii.AAC.1